MKTYQGDQLNHITFPLGGIGTGSIGLSGNGIPVDPEINNCPNRETDCGVSGFAVRAERDGKTVDCRLLCGDNFGDLSGTIRGGYATGAGFYAGFRHFDEVTFGAEFPFAKVSLSDSVFPGKAEMEAFNPMIPSNDRDSSIPAAFFRITLTNTGTEKMTYTIFQNMTNVLAMQGEHRYFESGKVKGITMYSAEENPNALKYGNLTIATDAEHTSHTDYWFRGKWFDQITMFKNDLMATGDLKNRTYESTAAENTRDSATLAVRAELEPGESKSFRFLISWYVPNGEGDIDWGKKAEKLYKNYYATLFSDSRHVTEYCFEKWERLYGETKRFANVLYGSSMPEEVLEAIGGNLAILKSSTCLRMEDGSFWGWEGVWRNEGSCFGTCQHVYNYAYALAFLFPKLEKDLRVNEIKYCMAENGSMSFRMPASMEAKDRWNFRACADGQMGFVIKCYREWKLSGDNAWLAEHFPEIKKCLEWAWSAENEDRWDQEKNGVLTGRQHHTLDVELFGVYAWLSGMYHAALAAAAEMAEFLGETELSEEYTEMFLRGKKRLDETTFNGEYFVQDYRVEDEETIRALTQKKNDSGACDSEDTAYYWDASLGQAKYQIEDGCEIDQVLAAWHADLMGLPEIFVPEHRKSALEAIYRYNFCSMHDLINPCRVFACHDERGVVMCRWPNEVRKPLIPVPYAEECMSGFEYAAAANMLQCGMEEEALEIVREIRRRYDGKRRNPFAELECGASYVRALASYSFLLVYSGFVYDLPHKALGFAPLRNGTYFWSVDGAWGSVSCEETEWRFRVDYGTLELEQFMTAQTKVEQVLKNGESIDFTKTEGGIKLSAVLREGDILVLSGRA